MSARICVGEVEDEIRIVRERMQRNSSYIFSDTYVNGHVCGCANACVLEKERKRKIKETFFQVPWKTEST